jgi:regulatory protein
MFLIMTRMITAIEPQKRDPKRVNIYLDGEFAFGLAGILAAWLKVGQALSEEKITALSSDDLLENTYQKALHYISYRPRSIHEVRKNLTGREIPESAIEETLKRLQENSLLNDQKFAKDWVENRNDFRPRSRSALRMELKQKGIPEEIIEITLEENIDEEALALQAAHKYKRRLENLDKLEFRKKLSAHLSRRGFSYTSINPVVSQVWNEIQPDQGNGVSLDSEDY